MSAGDFAYQLVVFLLLTVASYRIWRIFGYDALTDGWRAGLEQRMHHSRTAGVAYDVVTCPWMLGTFITCAVYLAASHYVDVWLPVAQALAASAVVGWLHTAIPDNSL